MTEGSGTPPRLSDTRGDCCDEIMPRFVLLEHVDSPDDPAGRHYDLLLEQSGSCRAWRLTAVPTIGGDAVEATPLPPHRLAWLEHLDGPVSRGRGHARRVDTGSYELLDAGGSLDDVRCTISGRLVAGRLIIAKRTATICSDRT